ncbi:MAG: D-glycero-beta-D-manno-heptose-7-phosphate kinase [Bacteroidia bacterium]
MDELKQKAKTLNILIIGDMMLDHYVFGKVERISPEAPVPIVQVEKEEYRLGGAANVALNLATLGAKVSICSVIGGDKEGENLTHLLRLGKIQTHFLLTSSYRKTTVKTRIIARQQQVLRIDKEDIQVINQEENSLILANLTEDSLQKYQVIIFEDYDKGLITKELIQPIMALAQKLKIPVLVDPKHRNFFSYENSFLFKPNLKEIETALGVSLNRQNFEELKDAIRLLREKMPHTHTLLTLSEKGMIWADEGLNITHFPTKAREILDVSGAGDTVIAVAALTIAAQIPLYQAFELANLAGGMVCEHVGVVPVQWEMLNS